MTKNLDQLYLDVIRNKIIQIVTPSVPVFAVYSNCEKLGCPKSWDEAFMKPCPVLALYEPQDKKGGTFVSGMVISELDFEIPDADNFLGYATSKEEAEFLYFQDIE